MSQGNARPKASAPGRSAEPAGKQTPLSERRIHAAGALTFAELRGTSIRERVQRLVSIAHPDFREDIMRQAVDMGIIGKQMY
ncbi:MAG: hypothetical protein FWB99_02525 [Treponema sp.]|nr:hypothetical protein [Treponema sp.]